MSDETAFWDAVDALREARPRYAREAYGFVVAALSATVQSLPAERRADAETRHLSGHELVAGVVQLARQEFGALAPMVFREWGVGASDDIGEIVFELVGCRQLSARPEDTMDDFRGGPGLMAELAAGIVPARPSGEAPGGRPGLPA